METKIINNFQCNAFYPLFSIFASLKSIYDIRSGYSDSRRIYCDSFCRFVFLGTQER